MAASNITFVIYRREFDWPSVCCIRLTSSSCYIQWGWTGIKKRETSLECTGIIHSMDHNTETEKVESTHQRIGRLIQDLAHQWNLQYVILYCLFIRCEASKNSGTDTFSGGIFYPSASTPSTIDFIDLFVRGQAGEAYIIQHQPFRQGEIFETFNRHRRYRLLDGAWVVILLGLSGSSNRRLWRFWTNSGWSCWRITTGIDSIVMRHNILRCCMRWNIAHGDVGMFCVIF
jgi:hypothetical protein